MLFEIKWELGLWQRLVIPDMWKVELRTVTICLDYRVSSKPI